MPGVEFEPTIPMFGLAETVHALDRAATVIGTHFAPVHRKMNKSGTTPAEGKQRYLIQITLTRP
jgi:hypothetical protein